MCGIVAASIIGFLCIFNKIRLAIAIIKTAAIFIKDEFLIILSPPIASIFLAGLYLWWIFTAMFNIFYIISYVYALGTIQGDGQSPFATVTLS